MAVSKSIRFTMGTNYVYDEPKADPKLSVHWNNLIHQPSDRFAHNLDQLKTEFRANLERNDGKIAALWSCIFGYCEAICTSKNEQERFDMYPIPLGSLERLVETEFMQSIHDATNSNTNLTHREAAQAVSNKVWSMVLSKRHVKDELHANSVYVCCRGKQNGKALDCFGAALCTVVGMQCLGHQSILTLSEDHAYESHKEDQNWATCEVAIPGSTIAIQKKRGREISFTFQDMKMSQSPQSSWLYMGAHPVYCQTTPMTLAACYANVNAVIETASAKNGETREVLSAPLIVLKRELLWLLYESNHLDSFPFALDELADAECHLPSNRDPIMCNSVQTPMPASKAIYCKAIQSSQTHYGDGQVYPYCYLGHFFKDEAMEDEDALEHLFVKALQCYYEASRVASAYKYEWGDSLQLAKTMIKLAEFVFWDIFCDGKSPRSWRNECNLMAATTWLIAFYDSLLFWEEVGGSPFLSILTPQCKTGISKTFGTIPADVRTKAFNLMKHDKSNQPVRTDLWCSELHHFVRPRSKRLAPQSLLVAALRRSKVSLSDMDLSIVVEETQDGRRSKRVRKGK